MSKKTKTPDLPQVLSEEWSTLDERRFRVGTTVYDTGDAVQSIEDPQWELLTPAEFAEDFRLVRDQHYVGNAATGLDRAAPEQIAALTSEDLAPLLASSNSSIRMLAIRATAHVGAAKPTQGRTR